MNFETVVFRDAKGTSCSLTSPPSWLCHWNSDRRNWVKCWYWNVLRGVVQHGKKFVFFVRDYISLYIYRLLLQISFALSSIPHFRNTLMSPHWKDSTIRKCKKKNFALQKIYYFISDFLPCIPLCQIFGATDRQSQIVWSRKVTTWLIHLKSPGIYNCFYYFYICPNSILTGNRMVRYRDPWWFQRCYRISWNRCPLVGFLFIRFLYYYNSS